MRLQQGANLILQDPLQVLAVQPLKISGGYIVQPPPVPNPPGGPSTKIEEINKINAAGNNQKETLFILGNAMSGAPIIKWNKPVSKATYHCWHNHKKNHYQTMTCN